MLTSGKFLKSLMDPVCVIGDLAEAQEDPVATEFPCFWRKLAEGYKNICQNARGIPRR
jgi:hypothetical protein